MIYDYDTEFYEDGERIHFISIGIVGEDGRELYLENSCFAWDNVPANHWLWENVYPHLVGEAPVLKHPKRIAQEVRQFITQNGTDFNNEIWAYYAAYDHVVLAQLFGRMVDMPEGVPWFTMDIKQEAVRLGNPKLPEQEGTEHYALSDAKWNQKARLWLKDYDEGWGPLVG